MNSKSTDPSTDLDDGWDDLDEESSPPGQADSRPVVKPVSTPPSDADELDAGWGDAPTPAPPLSIPTALGRPGAQGARRSQTASAKVARGDQSASKRIPAVSQRQREALAAASKKARRELERKHQAQQRRHKKTRKAERKAKRREEARLARLQREQELEAQRRRRAEEQAKKRSENGSRGAGKPASGVRGRAARRHEPTPDAAKSTSTHKKRRVAAPRAKSATAKRRGVRAQTRRHQQIAMITLAAALVLVSLWLLWPKR